MCAYACTHTHMHTMHTHMYIHVFYLSIITQLWIFVYPAKRHLIYFRGNKRKTVEVPWGLPADYTDLSVLGILFLKHTDFCELQLKHISPNTLT